MELSSGAESTSRTSVTVFTGRITVITSITTTLPLTHPRTLAGDFKYGLVWGTSTKFSPQRVGLTHEIDDEDVIMIVKK